jgi:hypothetical protein
MVIRLWGGGKGGPDPGGGGPVGDDGCGCEEEEGAGAGFEFEDDPVKNERVLPSIPVDFETVSEVSANVDCSGAVSEDSTGWD